MKSMGIYMHETLPLLKSTAFPAVQRGRLETLQVNLGYKCNQRCLHCHVNAGPHRTEMMSDAVLSLIVPVLQSRGITKLDLTGGAPELHTSFRTLVRQARTHGIHVTDRCNLTILYEPGQEDLVDFLATHEVEVVASLPCYSQENVDRQRGDGVFEKSIKALKKLNALGYGKPDSGLKLNLVYNPQGPSLPPNQKQLQDAYKQELHNHFGIVFNELYALANMPIKRFGSMLVSKGQFDDYIRLLHENHDPANLGQVMCRSQISVDWQGYLYDCDFNQQLGLGIRGTRRRHLRELLQQDIEEVPVFVADHCFGCTAGQGSSCSGAFGERVR
ncbi:MAG: arsenosugar biosynthesis radical SAM protein ArsS [Mariprofundaceae bacterium]|nr:arsenosugar biosynthesis radical SAM protein ArsS [Mariprofundaceae bacterium]